MTSPASGHCGPITAECLASCPASVISLMALNRLLDSDDAPQTVGDVVGLYQEGKLTGDTFRYLGPRRARRSRRVWCWPDSISRTGSATAKRGAPSDDQPGMAPPRRVGRGRQARDGR